MESIYKSSKIAKLSDYCKGIIYASGSIITESDSKYLTVRNIDKWYPDIVGKETGYHPYQSDHNIERDGCVQWIVKARNVHQMPCVSDIENYADFIRPYIELHGILDKVKSPKTGLYKMRLRIYGKEEILNFIMSVVPAEPKKMQYIKNRVITSGKEYVGKTCAIYYQSQNEIQKILHFIDDTPKNNTIWNKWEQIRIECSNTEKGQEYGKNNRTRNKRAF